MSEHTTILPVNQTPASTHSVETVKAVKESDNKNNFLQRLQVQCKLSVGAVDDPLEYEADATADKVMRMPEPSFIQRKCAYCEQDKMQRKPLASFIQKKEVAGNNIIQRDEKTELQIENSFKLKTTITEPDYLKLKTPFIERNALHLWDADAALNVWKYNFNYFKMIGVSDSFAGKAANFTAPFAIDAQLKAGNPKLWELSDKELNTTSIVGSAPLFSFDANFKNWKLLPFLQKKESDTTAGDYNKISNQSFIQRKCAHCEEEERMQRKPLVPFTQKKESTNNIVTSDAVTNQIQSTNGNGNVLPSSTKSFMESRFGVDFSNVRIHADSTAAQLSNQLNAQAFTVGNNVYFNEGKYQPESEQGRHLLAHELTHTIQQGAASTAQHIARFSDTGHHIIEEAGLAGGGFTEEQIKQIERGNIKRDYSQLKPLLNFALLCENDDFGGYHAEDHFDNYRWNDQTKSFEDRGIQDAAKAGLKDYKPTGDPVKQIEENILILMDLGATKKGLEMLGNAFHAVEDFFAHSNFMELSTGDTRNGTELITGSNDEGAAQIATARSLNAAGVPGMPVVPEDEIQKIKRAAPEGSHSKIAKDYTADPLHFEAKQLAALVVQDLSHDIVEILKTKEAYKRKQQCEAIVFKKIHRYLRPPDAAKDPWWKQLIAADKGAIDVLLKEATQRTPVTVNQCTLSPLVNLEATRNSPMRSFGIGNPVVGLGRVAFSSLGKAFGGVVNGSSLSLSPDITKDILLGSIPSVTIPFTLNGHRASATLGGFVMPPFGAVNTDESKYFAPGTDHGVDKYAKPQSGVGASISAEW